MALPELLDALRAQAAARRAEELARADAEVERLLGEASASTARRRADHLERAARDANEAARRTLSEARSVAARTMLMARDRLLTRVRAALDERIRAASGDADYLSALPVELGDALERLPSGEVIVRARPELAAILAQPARGRPGVLFETVRDMGVGFVAISPASGVEVDATLEAKLVHRWPRIAVSVLAGVGP